MKKSLNTLTIVSSILFVIFAGVSIGAAFVSKVGFANFFGEFFTCWFKAFSTLGKWFKHINEFGLYWGSYASMLALLACITFIVLTIVLSCVRKQGKKSFWSFLYFGGFLPAILVYAVGEYPTSFQAKSIFLYAWDLANNADVLGKVLGWSLIIVPIVLIGFVIAHFVLLMVSLSKKYANATQNEEIKEEEYVPYAANEAAYEEQAEPEVQDEEVQESEIKNENEVSTENEEDESMDIKALTESIRELVKEIVKEELEKQKVERHDFPPAGGPLVVQYFNGGINGSVPTAQVVPVQAAPAVQPAPAVVPAPQSAPVASVVKTAPVVEQPKAKPEPKPIKKAEPKVEEKVEEPKPVKEEPIIVPVEEPVVEEVAEDPVVEQPVEEPVAKPAEPVDEYDPYIDVFGSPNPNKEPAPAVVPVVPVVPAPEAEEDEEGEKKVYERISFTQRMKESDKELQDHYSELKNDILAYGVKSRISNSGDTFRLHTKTFVKITIAGKALKLYFALDPKAYENTTLPIGDASHKGSYEDIPLFFKVKSELSMRRAKQLILDAMTQDGLVQTEIGTTDWVSKLDSEELGEDED